MPNKNYEESTIGENERKILEEYLKILELEKESGKLSSYNANRLISEIMEKLNPDIAYTSTWTVAIPKLEGYNNTAYLDRIEKLDESIELLRSHLSKLSYEQKDILQSIKKQVNKLSVTVNNLNSEIHERLIPLSLEIDTKEYPLHRFMPIAIYLSEYDIEKVKYFISSLGKFLDSYEFAITDEYPPKIGSYWQKLTAKTKEALTSDGMKDTIDSAKHALELAAIEKTQSEVNKNHAEAASNLINSLENFENAAIQLGSLLIVKNTKDGKPSIAMKTLSSNEMIILAKNQKLLGNPSKIFDELSRQSLEYKKDI